MTVFFIFKQVMDKAGNVEKVELIECDTNEQNANRFAKLYGLQTPADLKQKVSYSYVHARIT